MDVHAIRDLSFARDPLRQHIGPLVATVGTAQFEGRLFQLVEATVGCEHLTAFCISASKQPRLILAANRGSAPVARTAASTYLSRHWDADPTNRFVAEDRDLAGGLIACVSAAEIQRLRYRRSCYSVADWERSGSNLVHKVTVIKRHEADVLKVNFYRHRETGPFDSAAIGRIAECSDFLFAFLARHGLTGASSDLLRLRSDFQRQLEGAHYGLTPREAQVCAGIAVGMSSEAIALLLGIGLNTVLTFRKRAYARLGICSQNELVRLIYSGRPLLQ